MSSVLMFCATEFLPAQGFGKPLTIQGIENFSSQSAASRGAGGIVFGTTNDASVMFSNPSYLRTVDQLQLSIGGISQSSNADQTQQYAPLKYYSSFSLFMEGLTKFLPNPVYDTSRTDYTAADTIQRPFDNLGPNWDRKESRGVPLQAFLSAPVNIGDVKLSVGVGYVEYANLNWYFQNNNVLSPSLLSPNPFVPTRPQNDADSNSVPIQWYQSLQHREGSIQGYGGALAITLFERLNIGFSGIVLSGSSDDTESRIERGRIRLYANYFRAESVYYRISQIGTSEYSGQEFTVSSSYIGKNVTAGFSLKLPTIITRTFKSTIKTDTTGSSVTRAINGEDQLMIPLRSTLALAINLRENLKFGFEYEIRSYESAEYTSSTKIKTQPWKSSNVAHIGLFYQPIDELSLRAGVREYAEVFEPEGNPLVGEPVNYTIYSAGAGFSFSNVRLNIAYEYSAMKFIDLWAGAVSINTKTTHAIVADVSYSILGIF